jgi:hypothetical protein
MGVAEWGEQEGCKLGAQIEKAFKVLAGEKWVWMKICFCLMLTKI